MIFKTVWLYEPLGASHGVNLIIRLAYAESAQRSERTCVIQLDRQGLNGKIERIEFPITKNAFESIQEGVAWLKEAELPGRKNKSLGAGPTIQHRCEGESGLVLMREIPAHQDPRFVTIQYKIGDGSGFDYVFESFDALDRFTKKLDAAVHTRISPD